MSKKLMIGAAAALAGAACVAAAKQCSCGPSPDRWARMRERMEQMPEDFPPRVMFDNVAAIRADTDEILSLLRELATDRAGAESPAGG